MGKERRDYPELCRQILNALDRPKTIGELSADVSCGWQTAERALEFLDELGLAKRIVDKPRRIYDRRYTVPVDDGFIKELTLITRKKGTRYHSIEDCVSEALHDFIRSEKQVKRY